MYVSVCALFISVFFFFSSRRRHTRLQGDWSSDVCSSDLPARPEAWPRRAEARVKRHPIVAAAVLALGAVAAGAGDEPRLRAADPADLTYTYTVGAFAPEYTSPAPGSYTLPPIDTVADHALLDADGRPTTL